MIHGQLAIGPPGSEKTAYCHAMSEFLRGLRRKVAIINLDPANDVLPYEASVDISHLITVKNVTQHIKLGPNGGHMKLYPPPKTT
ncbi:GPN-loop GTPase QQT1 [Trichonephila inaurata madagascariensis]|uniref:GPN-loop GTPase 2 n=1 Tax=Trichonephila inaurata madagascariensis TaxID=2747483 RepID=A0A8X7CQB0_9ARAC|nr:GPN-loop GTPase QQT1 [Trichonephila inaurata madagascariensis]